MERLGVFGGTFDPPHFGHLALARAARDALALTEVLWAVAADPPHKRGQVRTLAAIRVRLVQAAIAGEPGMRLSRVDLDRPGPHYSVDAVAILANAHPGAELIFLIGGDSLRDLPTWHQPQDLIRRCRLGVLRRPGAAFDLEALERAIPGLTDRIDFIDAPPVSASSRDIRARAAAGGSLKGLVAPAVGELIAAERLYGRG